MCGYRFRVDEETKRNNGRDVDKRSCDQRNTTASFSNHDLGSTAPPIA